MAEAMYLGKPVIATGYSGNLDFMTGENSYLVDYELVPIGPDAAPYPADGEWAEPNVDHAAALMREVFENPAGARQRGERAAADIRQTTRPGLGEQMRALQHTHARGAAGGPAIMRGRYDPSVSGRGARGPATRRPARELARSRSALLRAIKPFTAYQSQVNG